MNKAVASRSVKHVAFLESDHPLTKARRFKALGPNE